MLQRVRIALLIAALGNTQAQAGVFDDAEARRMIIDQKIKNEVRFDQQAKAQLDLASQIQRLAEENARLQGQIETLNYELETAKKRQQDFYLDLDTRLRKFERVGGAPATDPDAGTVAPLSEGDSGTESQQYEAALNQFKSGKYKEAAGSFSAYVQKYPDSSLAPNAQYWLGNAWYAQRNCIKAIEVQSVVISKYANTPKASDAWLAIATCQQELGNLIGAKRTLETLIAKYPNTPAAESAQQRLKK